MPNGDLGKYELITGLIRKKLNNSLSAEEEILLNQWLVEHPDNQAMLNRLQDEQQRMEDVELMRSFNTQLALEKLTERLGQDEARRKRRSRFAYISAAAAAVVLVLAATILFQTGKKQEQKTQPLAEAVKQQPAADSGQVLLTLSGGATIDIEKAGAGVVGQQQGALVTKAANGVLQYDAGKQPATDASAAVAYNILSVPRGKRYQIVLPDGSKVWLNAHTTLQYPVAFNGKERVIELNGEAYFEVAPRAGQPFKVITGNQVVEVLGTHFNVEAYAGDSRIVTTLAEGRVRVRKGNAVADMKPGQMAVNDIATTGLHTQQADLSAILAWKEGVFYFKDERIEDIMKKVARAYNVTVEFKTDNRDKRFWATFPMDKGLAGLLKSLEQTNMIHFELQPGKVIVL